MNEVKKLCIDCKHAALGYEEYLCTLFQVTSPVTGETRKRYCSVLRDSSSDCGPSGVFWEAKDAPAQA